MFFGGDKRNIIIAIGLVAIILIGWQFLVPTPQYVPENTDIEGQSSLDEKNEKIDTTAKSESDQLFEILPRDVAIKGSDRVIIESPRLHGSISLKGALFDDIRLKNYNETIDENSPEITIFSPKNTKSGYYASISWTGKANEIFPDKDTIWETNSTKLTLNNPIILSWDNNNGQIFKQEISVDDEFAFTIIQTVENYRSTPFKFKPTGLLRRYDPFDDSVYYKPWGIFQDGALGRVGELQLESDYGDMEDGQGFNQKGVGGWIGITSKYFLSSLIPEQNRKISVHSEHDQPKTGHKNRYDVYLTEQKLIELQPKETSKNITTHLFAGAKKVSILDMYEEKFGVESFDLAVDFGFVWFLSKPLFYALDFFFGLTGNFGVAILLLTICVRVILFPLANKAYGSMSRMRKLQPQMQLLRFRFGEDKQRLNQEMMQLYRRERANPLAGCLPILVQIPIFFALYSVLFVTIEMRHAPFFWWINDLAAPDPSALITAFGYLDWGAPSFLLIGIWPILFGITMFLQLKLNPQPIDPIQQKVMMALPFVFLFLFGQFPAGLVVYWTWNNVLSIAQQWLIMNRMGITRDSLRKEAEHLKLLKEGTGKEREEAIAALDAKLARDKKASEKARGGKKTLIDRILQTGEEAKEKATERRKKQDEKLAERKREFQRRANAKKRGKKVTKRRPAKSEKLPEVQNEPKVSRKERRAERAARAAKEAVKASLDKKLDDQTKDRDVKSHASADKEKQMKNRGQKSNKRSRKKK
ncbi:MAG: membrane protein insertase YidC [Rhodospirillaceae bacterium]|nr:membrane protein insertase YidC [Rhodospirillaceae bacterium]|tara:strand:- start:6843 stop:9110 length:2268 start_codon:yes stop_codon:yes gene_type:complete